MKWLILLMGVISNASASILIKAATSYGNTPISLNNPISIITNYYLICGVILYGVAFILYTLALTLHPLNIAHTTLTSGSIALVTLASVIIFGENISTIKIIGICLIIFGVCLLVSN